MRTPGRGLFVGAIGLAAFLLFTLELLTGRLVLPVFGGAPGVWTTALCFFTAVLFAGYLYAHLLVTRLGPRAAGIVHVVVTGIAFTSTALAPTAVATLRDAAMPEALNVLLVLAVIAGGPAFLLGSTTPLLSAWYAGRGGDPWWLYAASNAASLAGLIVYPFILQPAIGLSAQRVLVAAGLALFGLLLVAIVVNGRRPPAPVMAEPPSAQPQPPPPPPPPPPIRPLTMRRQVRWLFAAFVPAGLLAATTNFITTDLVSAPLLWVGPLAIYLLSLVVVFTVRGRRSLRVIEVVVPAAATLLWIPSIQPGSWPILALLFVELGAFAVLAIAIHGRLALDRPDDRQLTRFYLTLSAGGMLGTAFVALVAPVAFNAVYEYPILIVAALIVLVLFPAPDGRSPLADVRALLFGSGSDSRSIALELVRDVVPTAVAGGLLILLVLSQQGVLGRVVQFVVVGLVVVALGRSRASLAAVTAVAIVALTLSAPDYSILRTRTFFGVVTVESDGVIHAEYLGTTLHGLQFLDTRRLDPTSYFVRAGPIGEIFADLRARTNGASIGVVGLGAGTLAAYSQPGDTLTFFEIDRAIVDIATDARYFTYLGDAPVKASIVLGDARLTLRDQPNGSIDVLFLDAFTSDSVPTHLLTREAIAEYLPKLRPGGVIVFNVINRYYDLARPIGSTAGSIGLASAVRQYVPEASLRQAQGALPAAYLLVGRSEDIDRFTARGWVHADPGPVLTDDSFDLLRFLHPNAFF
jgi:hypothetical protein